MAGSMVTRHAGALEWARRRGIEAQWKQHFEAADVARVRAGGTVIGPLPVQLVAGINARGDRCFNIGGRLAAEERVREPSADGMLPLWADLVAYRVERMAG